MKDKDIVEKALIVSTKAHVGQYRRDGETPYIEHPLDVCRRLVAQGEDDNTIAVALLHDVLEDTEYTYADLYRFGFPQKVIDAVLALTKPKGQQYHTFIKNLSSNKIAVIVKLADMESNLADDPTAKQKEKYTLAISFLKSL